MRAYHHRSTWLDYLRIERDSNVKHEFVEGEIFAMDGGTPQHAALASRIIQSLGAQLKGRGCEVYTSDLRIRVPATGLGTYPDVSVVCGQAKFDPEDPNTVINPIVLVEVLSDSTEAYDRGDKLADYMKIPELREVLLVSHREALMEIHRRTNGDWERLEARTHGIAHLVSIGCSLDVDEIYAGIELHRSG